MIVRDRDGVPEIDDGRVAEANWLARTVKVLAVVVRPRFAMIELTVTV